MISLAMLFGTAAAALAAVWFAARKRAKALSEWAAGSRSFSAVMVFVLFAGENFTTFTLLGAAGWAYDKGVAATYTWCYTPLACLMSYWYLPKIWRYAKQHRAVSQSDYLRLRYDSKTLGVLITLVGVVAMTPYLALQLKGLAIIAHETSRQQIPVGAGVIAGAALVAVYSALGGLRGAAITSVVKDLAVVVVVLLVGVWLPYHLYGGPGPITRTVADQHPERLVLGPERGYGPAWFISTVLLCGLGAHMWPHLFASLFSARSEANLRRALTAAPFYTVALATTVTIGFAALVTLAPLGEGNEDLAFLRLVATTLPDPVLGFVGASGLLTALVPGSVLATTVATSLTRDGYANLRPDASESELARAAKWLLPIVVAVAAVFAFFGGQTIVGLLLAGYAIVAQALPAVVGSVLPRNPFTLEGVVAGLLAGTALAVAAPFVGFDWRHCKAFLPEQLAEVNAGLVALAVNLLVASLVSLWTRKPRPATAA